MAHQFRLGNSVKEIRLVSRDVELLQFAQLQREMFVPQLQLFVPQLQLFAPQLETIKPPRVHLQIQT